MAWFNNPLGLEPLEDAEPWMMFGTSPAASRGWFGPNGGDCKCSCTCYNCSDLYARYGYTMLSVSGLAGSRTLYDTAGVAGTYAGFSNTSLSIPNAQGGPCDDSIIQNVGMAYAEQWRTGPVPTTSEGGFIGSTTFLTQLVASNVYECFEFQDRHSLGINILYTAVGRQGFPPNYSESSFPDWTWSSITGGRQAVKTLGDGSTATWRSVSGPSGFAISISVGKVAVGGIAATSLSIPTVPWDPLGIMVGTVSIS